MESVGKRLRYIRDQKGLTLDQLAEKAGISKSFLWAVEQGRSGISGEKLLQVANALGASLEFLLRGEEPPEDFRRAVVEIPWELSEAAEELSLSYRQTVALLDIHHSIIARRSSTPRLPMTKEEWLQLFDGVEQFLREVA